MRIATVILLLFGVPIAAHAQTVRSSIFVEGAMLADHDPTHYHSNARFTPGGAGTVGFQLTQRFSARFDVEVPAFDTRVFNDYYPGALRRTTVDSARTVTYAGLFGWHVQPYDKRVDLSFLAGLSSVIQESHGSGYTEFLAKDDSVVRRESWNSSYSSRYGALTFGADVAVAVNAHLSVVPEVRFHAYSEYGTITRSKVAIRWTF
jgi:hypothetical protein